MVSGSLQTRSSISQDPRGGNDLCKSLNTLLSNELGDLLANLDARGGQEPRSMPHLKFRPLTPTLHIVWLASRAGASGPGSS